jgi:acetyltransferase-like isoleucine patch superfamily enzyme
MRYLKRLIDVFFNIINTLSFKQIHLTCSIKPSVRIEGKKFISIGKRATIRRLGWILALKIDENEPQLSIEEGVEIGDFCHIACVRKVKIEQNVIIAHGVYISDNVHSFSDVDIPIKFQPIEYKSDVIIGNGSWIGEHACIIGAKIGKNCVIGANVVVTKDVPDYTTVLPHQKIEWNYYSK